MHASGLYRVAFNHESGQVDVANSQILYPCLSNFQSQGGEIKAIRDGQVYVYVRTIKKLHVLNISSGELQRSIPMHKYPFSVVVLPSEDQFYLCYNERRSGAPIVDRFLL